MTITEEMRRVAESHERNGERYTATLLRRARDHINDLEADLKRCRIRLQRIARLENGK